MTEQEEKPVEKFVNPPPSDSDFAAHSLHIRQILADSDIHLPYCINLNVIVRFLEKEIQGKAYFKAKYGDFVTIDDVSEGDRLLTVFQTIPTTYYALVRDNIPSIHESFNDYITSCAKERAENEAAEPFICTSDNGEKKEEEMEEVHSESDDDEKKKRDKEFDEMVSKEAALMKKRFPNNTILVGGLDDDAKADIPAFIKRKVEEGKADLASGSLHCGADKLAYAAILSEPDEDLMSNLKKTLHPAHIDLIREKRARYEQECDEYRKKCIASAYELPQYTVKIPAESSDIQKKQREEIDRPESITEGCWKNFYDLGRRVSDFVLDAFEMYETGDFASWDKNRVKEIESSLTKKDEVKKRDDRNRICEYVFIERMKAKEFFCCNLCKMAIFNYKNALIHFTSTDHCKKETDAVRKSGIDYVRRVLDLFTELPKKWIKEDVEKEVNMRNKFGGMVNQEFLLNLASLKGPRYYPSCYFMSAWESRNYDFLAAFFTLHPLTSIIPFNVQIASRAVLDALKTEAARKAFTELHDHLGEGPTYCVSCFIKTGDRDGYYRHQNSHCHLMRSYSAYNADPTSHQHVAITALVNVFKKDLIV